MQYSCKEPGGGPPGDARPADPRRAGAAHAPTKAYIQKLAAQYMSAHPNVTINHEPAPDNNTYEDKALTALASGGGPDIFNVGLSSMYTFAGLGQLEEITPRS